MKALAPVEARVSSAHQALERVADPEIPAISIVELGMVREVREEEGTLVVELLPTFSGCPAIGLIVSSVADEFSAAGLSPFRVRLRVDLPWSTEMISAEGRRKLAEFGVIPPQRARLQVEELTCPICGERSVRLVSAFGPTPCRAIAKCRGCGETLEVFKPIGVRPEASGGGGVARVLKPVLPSGAD